jgi:methylated-DNA-protein-cysteine methyltransferase related protein
MPSIKAQIIEIVNKIPCGKVMYFGQIGKLIVNKNQEVSLVNAFAGVSGQAVGFALSGMPQSQWNLLPWHRVVAKDGYISSLKLGAKGLVQKQLLLDEGVSIIEDRVDMIKHLYDGDIGEVLF